MNIGACRRALTTRSSSPLPRIGSVLAVQVTTMSNSAGARASRSSVIASAPKRVGELLAALQRAVGDRDRLAACARRSASRRARSSRPRRSAAAAARRVDGKMRSRELHRGGRHRDRRAADVGLRAHVLRHGERALEQPVRARSPSVPADSACAHRLLHLAEDLRLAQHHRVEPARDAERVRAPPARAAACRGTATANRPARRWKSSSQRATRLRARRRGT